MSQVNTAFPESAYTALNKPSVETLKSDISALQTGINDNDDNAIIKGGTTPFEGDQSMGSNKMTNLKKGTADEDAIRIDQVYPVGSVYVNVAVETNPATLLGFGTWEAFAAGRVLVGIDETDEDFNVVEETGGAKEHTLTGAESGEKGHNHIQDSHYHNCASNEDSGSGYATLDKDPSRNVGAEKTGNKTATNQAVAASDAAEAHTNVQPYLVAYMWKRTA